MNMDDFFGKFDDILFKPVEAIVDYVREPLEALHNKREQKNAEHTAKIEMQMRAHEEQLKAQSIREAAELEFEMKRAHAEMNLMIEQQEDERRDRLVESIKRYQLELATASRDIVNSIGKMSLELRERANDMVRENTLRYKEMQSRAMDEADARLADIQERYADNERIRIRMEDTVIKQMDSIIDTASKFITELSEDIKRMNANTDQLTRIQMENVNSYLQPMTSALQVGISGQTNLGAIECTEADSDVIETELMHD